MGIRFMGKKPKLRTYFPFRGVKPFPGAKGNVGGVFELIQDMSKQYASIVEFQYLVFGLSLLIMGLIFLALLLIVQKAERLIEQRAREQRELEDQLHQAERLAALGEMVAGVSHEIKNPLGIVQSTAELLGGMPNADATQKKLSGVIKEESRRLNRIVTEFLDFARPQTPNLQTCYLEEIIQKNLFFLSPEFEKRQIQVNHDLDGRKFEIEADQDLLYRAFLNIFMNAIQSMDGGGQLVIQVDKERGTYRLSVQDTGCGISQENVKKIFNPFFTTKEKGTGLGLSIVRKIVEGHGGMSEIESREDEGTKVTVQLPKKGQAGMGDLWKRS